MMKIVIRFMMLVTTFLPLAALADLYIPPTYHRYQRIGYEVLPDAEALLRENVWELGLLMVVVSVLIGMIVCLGVRKVWRNKIWDKAYPKIKSASKYCLLGVCVCCCWMAYSVFMDILSHLRYDPGNPPPIYDPAPGWKYPTELSEKEKVDFNSKLNSLPLRMRELIEAKWKKDPFNGSDDHAKAVVLEVLRSEAELRSACIGIPVEVIVSHYFITEKWRQYYSRNSFTHPRTVPWDDMKAKVEKIIDEDYMKSHPRSKCIYPEHKFVD